MKKIILSLLIVLVFVITTGVAKASLIVNGSFEDPIVSGTWELFSSVPGWSNADLTEIQNSSLYGPAADGNQFVELDSNILDGNNWLAQTFYTDLGKSYTFTFAYSPRPGVEDNTLYAGIASYDPSPHWLTIDTLSASGMAQSQTSWAYYSYTFLADTTSLVVAFKDAGPDDGYGTLIDDVSVKPVPEPTTMLLLGLGLVGLAGIRRKMR